MAKLLIVAVFDSAVRAYNRPFFVPALGAATRSFNDEVNRKAADNAMHAHPDDFELWSLGEYDEDSGIITQSEIRCIARAKDVWTE